MAFTDAKTRQCYERLFLEPTEADSFFFTFFFPFVQSIKGSLLGDTINQMTSNHSLTVLYMRLSSDPFVTSANTRPFIKQMEDMARQGEMAVMSNRVDR